MFKNIFVVLMDFLDGLYIPRIHIMDILEILIMVFVTYYILKTTKKTRAWIFMKAIMFMLVAYVISFMCGFNAITVIFEKSVYFLIVGVIVILQPELRRLFESIGIKKVNPFKQLKRGQGQEFENRISLKTVDGIVDACKELSKAKTGALIVIEKDVPLHDYISSGIMIDATITKELLINTFEHNTPLHDGAVIITNDRMTAATCYLPLSENKDINKEYGTRHRAAIGMSEVTDSFCIVVSEETGHMTVAYMGNLYEKLSPEDLMGLLLTFRTTEVKVENKTFLEKMKNNSSLKILSVIIACVSWITLMNIYDPISTVAFNNIPVTVINEAVVADSGQAYKIVGESNLDIIVKDNRSVLEKIKADNIKITADMNKLSSINTIPVNVSIIGASNANVIFPGSDSLKIQFEDIISKEFNIEINPVGVSASGYHVGDIKLNRNTVTLTAPRSQMNLVSRVVLDVDINGVSTSFNKNGTVTVYDVNGNKMDKVSVDSGVIYASGTVYRTKLVDVKINVNADDVFAYTITDVEFSPTSVRIAAKDDVLDATSFIGIDLKVAVDETKINNGKYITEISVKDYLPDNLVLVNEEASLVVTMSVSSYIKKEMTLSSEDIIFSNVKDNMSVAPDFEEMTFSIWVPSEWADTITVADIEPKVDFTNAVKGNNTLPITFVADLIKLESTISGRFIVSEKEPSRSRK